MDSWIYNKHAAVLGDSFFFFVSLLSNVKFINIAELSLVCIWLLDAWQIAISTIPSYFKVICVILLCVFVVAAVSFRVLKSKHAPQLHASVYRISVLKAQNTLTLTSIAEITFRVGSQRLSEVQTNICTLNWYNMRKRCERLFFSFLLFSSLFF